MRVIAGRGGGSVRAGALMQETGWVLAVEQPNPWAVAGCLGLAMCPGLRWRQIGHVFRTVTLGNVIAWTTISTALRVLYRFTPAKAIKAARIDVGVATLVFAVGIVGTGIAGAQLWSLIVCAIGAVVIALSWGSLLASADLAVDPAEAGVQQPSRDLSSRVLRVSSLFVVGVISAFLLYSFIAVSHAEYSGQATAGHATLAIAFVLLVQVVVLDQWASRTGRMLLAYGIMVDARDQLPEGEWSEEPYGGSHLKYLSSDDRFEDLAMTVVERLPEPVQVLRLNRVGRQGRDERGGITILSHTVIGVEPDPQTLQAVYDRKLGSRELTLAEMLTLAEHIDLCAQPDLNKI